MNSARSLLAALLMSCALHAVEASAAVEELAIQDTQGIMRAVSTVEGTGGVEFSVVDAAGAAVDGAEVTLTNAATGEVLTSVASNGVVAFEGVAPGVWTVASTAPGLTFTNVTITSAVLAAGAGVPGALALGPLATGVGVAGGAGAIAVGVNEAIDDDSDDPVLSPSS